MTRTPSRRTLRLRGYDYARPGAYYVTVCTRDRKCLFGDIADGQMMLNAAGHVAVRCWEAIPKHYPQALLDAFVVMPNHVHGVVFLVKAPAGAEKGRADGMGVDNVRAKDFSPLRRPRGTSGTIGAIVRGFKIGVTKWMRQNTSVEHIWQRNYYEHIIRDEDQLHRIRAYIAENPKGWDTDRENPDARQ